MKKKIIVFRATGMINNKNLELALSNKDFNVKTYPIMKIKGLPIKEINTKGCQAILTSSINSLFFLSKIVKNKNIQIFTLGKFSYQYAKKVGFKNIIDCNGDGVKMLSIILNKTKNDKGKIIYAGAKKISVDIPKFLKKYSYEVERILLYDTENINHFNPKFSEIVKKRNLSWIVLLSQKGAKNFFELFEKVFNSKEKKSIKYACISAKVAKELKSKEYQTFFPNNPSIEEIKNLITNYEKNHGN